MRGLVWVVGLAMLTGTRSVHAQRLVPRIGELSRVRLMTDSTQQWRMGWVRGLTTMTFIVRDQIGQESEYPIASIAHLELRRGTWMREAGLVGGVLGVGIGLVAGESASTKLLLAGTGALSLGISAASIGRRYPRWVTVDVPRLLAGQLGDGENRFRVSIRVAW